MSSSLSTLSLSQLIVQLKLAIMRLFQRSAKNSQVFLLSYTHLIQSPPPPPSQENQKRTWSVLRLMWRESLCFRSKLDTFTRTMAIFFPEFGQKYYFNWRCSILGYAEKLKPKSFVWFWCSLGNLLQKAVGDSYHGNSDLHLGYQVSQSSNRCRHANTQPPTLSLGLMGLLMRQRKNNMKSKANISARTYKHWHAHTLLSSSWVFRPSRTFLYFLSLYFLRIKDARCSCDGCLQSFSSGGRFAAQNRFEFLFPTSKNS